MVARGLQLRSRRDLGLRMQVLVSGFAVMVLELVGSRLVAPVFGNSIFTWGSLIGVVLTALSIGYHYGGKLADRAPSPRKFSSLVFTSGLFVVLVPFITPFALGLSLSLGLSDQYGPLLASALILGPPTIVLGMTSPYAVKIAAQTLASLGNVAGNLYSLSTIGSIMGVFGAAFVLIPLWDVRSILFGQGLALMLVALIWLPKFPLMVAVATTLLLVTPFSFTAAQILMHSGSVVYEKETLYSHLDVVDAGRQRTLYLNGLAHSGMDLDNSTRLVFTYTRYFHLGFLIDSNISDVLFVGGGGFSGPKSFLAAYPNVRVDVVEIDPDVIQTAQRYFAVDPHPRLTIVNMDGRIYLMRSNKVYDLIILDAYAKTYVPFHLMTREFMELLSARLTPQGVVISNLIGSLVGDTSDLVRAEYRTVASVFPNVAVFTTSDLGPGVVQNLILAFTKSGGPPLVELLDELRVVNGVLASKEYTDHIYRGRIPVGDVPLLTDDYAPVESLLNPITGQPYVLEQQEGRLTPLVPFSAGSASFAFILLVLMGVAWFVYLSKGVE